MTKRLKYHGAVVPLVTPFTAEGNLDEPALHRLIDSQIAGGVEGVFVLGTTGEGAHVPKAARRQLVAQTVKRVNGRAVVFAGLGDIRADLTEANEFFRAGADAGKPLRVHAAVSDTVPRRTAPA